VYTALMQSAGLRENFGTMTKPFHAGVRKLEGIPDVRTITALLSA
jgi:hypothetical protein